MKRTRFNGVNALFVLAALAAALAVTAGVTASSRAASTAVSSASSLVPDIITTGRMGSYAVSYTNTSATLTHVTIQVRLPPGATLVSSHPTGCSSAVDPADGATVVTCARRKLGSGATIDQGLLFRSASSSGNVVVTSSLIVDHGDRFAAPAQTYEAVPVNSDSAGGCLGNSDRTLSTEPGTSTANQQVTAAMLPPLSVPCVPVVLTERPRLDAHEGCPLDVTCTTEISFTSASAFPATTPIRLVFTLDRSELPASAIPSTFGWYKDGVLVPDCLGSSTLAAGQAACVTGRATAPGNGIQLDVLWDGTDPSWTG